MLGIEAFLELKDNMSAGLARATSAMDRARAATTGLGSGFQAAQNSAANLRSTLLGIGAGLGAVYSIKELATQFIQANAEVETTTKRVGGLLSGLYEFDKDPAKNFREGMRAATKMVEDFDEAEGEIGVDKGAMLAMSQRLAPSFAAAGKTIEDTTKFTVKLSDTARQLGQNGETAAMQMTMMLQYGMVPQRAPIVQALNISRQEMHKLKTEAERFEYISKRLQVFKTEEMRKVKTLNETMEELRIVVGNIYEEAGKPVFNAARDSAIELLKYLRENRKELTNVAGEIGSGIVGGFKLATGAAKLLLENIEGIWTIAKSVGAILAGYKIAAALAGFVANLGLSIEAAFLLGIGGFQIALSAAVGYAIAQGIMWAMKKTGVWEPFQNLVTFGAAGEQQRRLQQGEAERVEMLDKFKTDITAQISEMTGTKKAAELQAMYKRAQEEDTRTAIAEVAKSLGIDLKTAPPARGGMNVNFNNNRFDIKQEFAEGFDPDRIAVAFASDLARLGEMKMQSAMSFAGAMR